MQDVRVTVNVAIVLRALLSNPTQRTYGYDLMRLLDFPSGKLYPILNRLEMAGWLESEFEQIDQKAERRPPRRWYRLTGDGATAARREVALLYQQLAPASDRRARRRPEGSPA